VDINQLTDDQMDALQEISNIGMGHAATALSQLIARTVSLNVPRLRVLDLVTVPQALGGAEQLVFGIYLRILGDARGNILLIFPQESACQLVGKLLMKETPAAPLDELEASTLKEVGNILASAFLNALGRVLKMTLIPSIPLISHDMAGAVVDYLLVDLGMAGDSAVMIETDFQAENDPITGHFFLIPDPASLGLILDSIGV